MWGGTVKALTSAPCAPQVFPFVAPEARGPLAGPVPGESLHHIPFSLFQASLCEQHHPRISASLSSHPCRVLTLCAILWLQTEVKDDDLSEREG